MSGRAYVLYSNVFTNCDDELLELLSCFMAIGEADTEGVSQVFLLSMIAYKTVSKPKLSKTVKALSLLTLQKQTLIINLLLNPAVSSLSETLILLL